MYSFVFFFFQAEDGIRDFHVTGVQTCALPISFIVVIFAMTFSACSIRKQKDEKSRFFLNFGTRYNILYNGNALLEEGERAMNETITDNYQQELYVFKEPTEASIQ